MEITTIVYGVMGICITLVLVTLVMEYQEKKKTGQTKAEKVIAAEEIEEVAISEVKQKESKPKPKRKPRAKKEPKFNPNAVDRDKDGIIQEGTKFERPVEKRNEVPKKAPARRGRPKKANGKKETKTNSSKK